MPSCCPDLRSQKHSALTGISKSLQCSCSVLCPKKNLLLKIKTLSFLPIFQLIKYSGFHEVCYFLLSIRSGNFFIPLVFTEICIQTEKISVFPSSHPILIGEATFSFKTGLTVTQFTTSGDVLFLLRAMKKGPGILELE